MGSQRHSLAALPPRKRLGIHVIGGWWAPGPVWTDAENLAPQGFDPRTVQPVASRYTHGGSRLFHKTDNHQTDYTILKSRMPYIY